MLSDYSLSHGESVAIGIALDSIYSHKKGFLAEGSLARILKLVQSFGFRIYHECLSRTAEDGQYLVLLGLEEFREHMGGKLTIPLLKEIGDQFEVNDMDAPLLLESIESLRSMESTLQR